MSVDGCARFAEADAGCAAVTQEAGCSFERTLVDVATIDMYGVQQSTSEAKHQCTVGERCVADAMYVRLPVGGDFTVKILVRFTEQNSQINSGAQ